MNNSKNTVKQPRAKFSKTHRTAVDSNQIKLPQKARANVPTADSPDKVYTNVLKSSRPDSIAATAAAAVGFPYVVDSSAPGNAGTVSTRLINTSAETITRT